MRFSIDSDNKVTRHCKLSWRSVRTKERSVVVSVLYNMQLPHVFSLARISLPSLSVSSSKEREKKKLRKYRREKSRIDAFRCGKDFFLEEREPTLSDDDDDGFSVHSLFQFTSPFSELDFLCCVLGLSVLRMLSYPPWLSSPVARIKRPSWPPPRS